MMNPRTTKPQDLREAFASIITMILGLLRAHGLRGLRHLPALSQAAHELRRLGDEFCDLFAAFQAGTLPPVPAPAPQPLQAAPTQLAAPPRASARPAALRHRRSRPSQPAPRIPRAPNRRATNLRAVRFARAYRTLGPQLRPGPQADILVTARST
jgi:hypothetical protein